MAGEAAFDPGGILVSVLRPQPKVETGRDAANRERSWRDVLVDDVQECVYST